MSEKATHNAIDFTQEYILLRSKEGRIYTDKEVANLPEIDKEHQHYDEWHMRKQSSGRLIKYLANKKKNLEILEVGCGNGWLSARLASIPLSLVTGIDITVEELRQAKKVFCQIENLEFFIGSLQREVLNYRKFDIIVFAASIQYFPDFKKIVSESLRYLRFAGEIHIIDSHFYKGNEISAARLRSSNYYQSIGFPEMEDRYFHHSLAELRSFNYDTLYDPNSIINKLRKNKNPFYWIVIRDNA
jgi:ubiquinone/menaquinone biosynthesis C-methylase UbiE